MTRQSRARWLAFATAALVVALAALFAALRNRHPADRPAATTRVEVATGAAIDAGRQAFRTAGCAQCHSAEGRGNPALPLDGVARRLDREALRASAFASQPLTVPDAVAEAKRRLAGDPQAEALLDYLQQLR